MIESTAKTKFRITNIMRQTTIHLNSENELREYVDQHFEETPYCIFDEFRYDPVLKITGWYEMHHCNSNETSLIKEGIRIKENHFIGEKILLSMNSNAYKKAKEKKIYISNSKRWE